MLNKIEGLLRELFTCLQSAKMYGTDHILFQKALDKAYLVFQDALSSRDELMLVNILNLSASRTSYPYDDNPYDTIFV